MSSLWNISVHSGSKFSSKNPLSSFNKYILISEIKFVLRSILYESMHPLRVTSLFSEFRLFLNEKIFHTSNFIVYSPPQIPPRSSIQLYVLSLSFCLKQTNKQKKHTAHKNTKSEIRINRQMTNNTKNLNKALWDKTPVEIPLSLFRFNQLLLGMKPVLMYGEYTHWDSIRKKQNRVFLCNRASWWGVRALSSPGSGAPSGLHLCRLPQCLQVHMCNRLASGGRVSLELPLTFGSYNPSASSST